MTVARALILIATLLLICTDTFAGSWRVAPLRVNLDRNTRSSIVRVTNAGNTPVRIQVNTVAWQQSAAGEDIYSETTDLLAFPKIATLEPNQDQIIRVGIKRPALQSEKTFRLFIQEIPPATPEGGASVAVALRIGIPVFSAPLQPVAEGAIHAARVGEGLLTFAVGNSGNVTNKLEQFLVTVLDRNGSESFNHEFKPWYLHPGTEITRTISLPPEICHDAQKILISAHGDKLKLEEHLDVIPERCGN